eukprot:jgi/Mesvir1/10566/Mv21786-RA.2
MLPMETASPTRDEASAPDDSKLDITHPTVNMLQDNETFRFQRWCALTAGIWICTTAGTVYLFSLYSEALKKELGYSQKMIQGLASAKDAGCYIGIVAGLFYDRFTPRKTLAIGLTMQIVGYFVVWLAATGRVAPSYMQLLVVFAVAANGTAWLDVSALATCIRNFPQQRGAAVGILKSFVGLSGALFTLAYRGLLMPHASLIPLMMCIVPLVFGAPMWTALRLVPDTSANSTKEFAEGDAYRFRAANVLGIILAVYLLASIFVQDLFPFSRELRLGLMLGMFGILLLTLLLPTLKTQVLPWRPPEGTKAYAPLPQDDDEDGADASGAKADHGAAADTHVHLTAEPAGVSLKMAPLSPEESRLLGAGASPRSSVEGGEAGGAAPLLQGPSYSLLQCLVRVDFWLLGIVFMFGGGCGVTIINNLGQIVVALGGAEHTGREGKEWLDHFTNTMVSIVAISNCVGRIVTG